MILASFVCTGTEKEHDGVDRPKTCIGAVLPVWPGPGRSCGISDHHPETKLSMFLSFDASDLMGRVTVFFEAPQKPIQVFL